jgi:hypothetical protein
MLDQKEIFSRAYNECMTEMYAKAQPSADWNQILKDFKEGKYDKNTRIYERYYLSQEEFAYILNKYIVAYNFKERWTDYVDTVTSWFEKGGYKPNYNKNVARYKEMSPAKDIIDRLCKDKDLSYKIWNVIMFYLESCKDFYRFDRTESDFRIAISLGASPSSNKETVKKWWKDNKGIDIEIEDRNPSLLWDKDYYGDEFEEVMKEEYGENWREEWNKTK